MCVTERTKTMDRCSEAAGVAGGRLWRRCEFVGEKGEMDRRFLRKSSEEERLRKRSKSDKSPL